MITFEQIKADPSIRTYIQRADESLIYLGYTEHSFAHVGRVAETARYILLTLGYSEREAELAQIAGYLHDIGNVVNRIDHAQSGAVMAFRILDRLGQIRKKFNVANGFFNIFLGNIILIHHKLQFFADLIRSSLDTCFKCIIQAHLVAVSCKNVGNTVSHSTCADDRNILDHSKRPLYW